MHGGDIYRTKAEYDFSVNLNPLGMPHSVISALSDAVLRSDRYPDILNEELTEKASEILEISDEKIVFGNGASELILAVCHTFLPEKVMMPAPSFSGYKYAASAVTIGNGIIYHYLSAQNGFDLKDDLSVKLEKERPDLLFLANPNNPNGLLTDEGVLKGIITKCDALGITLILDECFLPLTGKDKERSYVKTVDDHPSLIIIRSFTKTFSIAGVRLGYAVCSKEKADIIKTHLPEWNLSVFAQKAGIECLNAPDFVQSSAEYVMKERTYMTNKLSELGFWVFPSDANYILLKSGINDLSDRLMSHGILIRDCSDYEGLSKGYYRIAVKSRSDNDILLQCLKTCSLQ
ncbi:MAG: aminotransferase class I/II-fold pyridoxal phosphate-dependent enzyme [Lachnospiraceae bacterium]|nr:aminotransferase class I/II-fold pyridoxal phosphate-dependent enzyme [Lachnospiraceae bacterium]